MHRPVRQIEVFDISLMAVVTKAMGAFLVIMLLLMPYYRSDPNVAASAKDAQKTLEEARQQVAAMQRQLAGSPEDVEALKRALAAMAETLAQAQQQIIALGKQAEALSAQLVQARAEADAAEAKLKVAEAAVQEARADAKEAQIGEVEMEQEANDRARAAQKAEQARAAQKADPASSQSKQPNPTELNTENDQLRALVTRSVLPPRRLVVLSAIVPAGCGDIPFTIGHFSADHTYHLPEGISLDVLDEAEKQYYLTQSTPTYPFGPQLPAVARPGQPAPRVIGVAIVPDPGRTGFLYARAGRPPAAECRFEVTGRILNLETGDGEEIQRGAVLAAGRTTPDLLMVLTGEETEMVRVPDAEDFSTWRRVLPALIRQLDTPAPKPDP